MENFKGRGELRSGHVSGREGATSFYEASSADVQIPNMSTETQKAIDAVRFIAAHLKNEDDYAEVGKCYF